MGLLTEYDPVKEKKKMENSIRKHVRKEDKELAVEMLMEYANISKEEAIKIVEEAFKDSEKES